VLITPSLYLPNRLRQAGLVVPRLYPPVQVCTLMFHCVHYYCPTFAFLRSLICIMASLLNFTHLAQRNLPLVVTPPSISLCTKQLLHRFHRSGFVSTGYMVNIILSLVLTVSSLSLRYPRCLVFLL
jgi:hypothetical protein